MNTLGKRLKYSRKQKGYTQDSLAETIGISRGVIFNLEKDKTEPQRIVLNALCQTLKINKNWLLYGTGNAEESNKDSQNSAILTELYNSIKGSSKEEQIIIGFRDLYNKIAWLNKLKLEENFKNDSFKTYKFSEIACIEYIGKNVDFNVTKLAESFYMTRGALSKMTKKLIKKGIIESYQKPDNKKEIYFRLTSQGQKIYDIHEEMHKKFIERDRVVFEQVTEEQFTGMLNFFEKYNSHLDKEIKKMNIDTKSE